MKSIPDEKSTTHMSESFHSQQELEEHTEFIHNSQKNKHLCLCSTNWDFILLYIFF